MEKLRFTIGDTAPQHFLIESAVLAEQAGQLGVRDLADEAYKKFGGDFNIEFKVNGHELPFSKVVEEIYKRMEDSLEKRAAEKALEIIMMSGFQELVQTMQSAEWKIREKIKEVTGLKDF